MSESTERIARERAFHDDFTQYRAARAATNDLTAELVEIPRQYTLELAQVEGKRVFDYGCGTGGTSGLLRARSAAQTIGADLSFGLLQVAHQQHADAHSHFVVANVERTPFPAAYFDVVFGKAILHHLDLRGALTEIHRVLRPNGYAIFLEPLAHNPFINLYRRLTPRARTVDEHPLTMNDIHLMEEIFDHVAHREFYLTTLGLLLFRRWLPSAAFDKLMRLMHQLDADVLFRIFPFLRRYAWITVLRLQK